MSAQADPPARQGSARGENRSGGSRRRSGMTPGRSRTTSGAAANGNRTAGTLGRSGSRPSGRATVGGRKVERRLRGGLPVGASPTRILIRALFRTAIRRTTRALVRARAWSLPRRSGRAAESAGRPCDGPGQTKKRRGRIEGRDHVPEKARGAKWPRMARTKNVPSRSSLVAANGEMCHKRAKVRRLALRSVPEAALRARCHACAKARGPAPRSVPGATWGVKLRERVETKGLEPWAEATEVTRLVQPERQLKPPRPRRQNHRFLRRRRHQRQRRLRRPPHLHPRPLSTRKPSTVLPSDISSADEQIGGPDVGGSISSALRRTSRCGVPNRCTWRFPGTFPRLRRSNGGAASAATQRTF
mmetsp:Transcript_118758/g.335991  ORF Transcript_118758/g.335991 Transcript_118758/m.335991 type:complete len:359 (-) Transcript_118758:119-1195(-)